MKAENENIENELKDEMLSKSLKGVSDEDRLSSNFTHQVMGKIEQLEGAENQKPLLPAWAWIIIAGGFISAIVLAVIYGSMPEEAVISVDESAFEIKDEYGQYLALATGVMAVVFVEMLIRYKKNSTQQ